MRKILTALTIAGLSYFGANAQTTPKACGTNSNKVCRMSSKGQSCYPTRYAENFKVCKGNRGYFICCETPNKNNSTHPGFSVPESVPVVVNDAYNTNINENNTAAAAAVSAQMIAPQSQSYPPDYVVYALNNGMSYENSSSYEGYYPRKDQIRVCYYGDNVAENSRMPYHGCPSPQYDGPDRNAQRNLNANSPLNLPPINGWGH